MRIEECGVRSEKQPRVVSFVAASSNSGKTTLIEKVVVILKARGLRVAVVKHASSGFDLDSPGKDSWRFQRAGADPVVLVGPDRLARIENISRAPAADELVRMAGDVDVVIYEGFKRHAENRIEVFRFGVSGDRPLCLDDPSFLALVSDRPFDVPMPCFDLDDAEGVVDFVMKF
jgi:molybdopterin-guanine dinucleotide biosynthesis protein B